MADATVTLGLNAAQLTAGLRRAATEVAGFSNKAKASFSGAFSGGMVSGFLGAAGIGGIKSIMNQYDDLADAAIRLGESAETIQRVEFATKQLASVDMEGLVSSFLKLEKAMGDSENEDAVAALEKFGVTAKSLSAMSLDEKILALRDAFSQAKATGSGYNAMLDLFGKSAGNLIPIFEASREQIIGLMDDANAMSDSAVNNIAAMNDEMDGFLANTYAGAGALVAMITGVGKAAKALASGGVSFTDALYEGFGSGDADAAAINRDKERAAKAEARATAAAAASAEKAKEIAGKQKTNTYDIAKNLQEQANAANSILAPYQQFLNFLDEAKRKQDAIDSKKDADRQATQSKIEGQKEAAQALQDEIDLLTVRASGDEKAIRDAEAALAIKQRTRQIQRDMNVDAKTARGIAEQIASLEQKGKRGSGADTDGDGFISKREQRKSDLEQKRGQRKADSIKGFSRDRAGLSAFGGLLEHSILNTGSSGNRTIPVGKGFIGMRNELDSTEKRSITPNLFDFFDGKRPESSSDKIAAEIRQLKDIIKERLTVD
jgi:hypothetical protein